MEQNIRKCQNFNPHEYLCHGKDDSGDTVIYLPAYARILWMNAYQSENNILMGLTTEKVSSHDDAYMTYRATLTQFMGCNYDGTFNNNSNVVVPVTIASCISSALINDDYGPEGVETKAQARCLRLAGFNVEVETASDDFFEGTFADAPVKVTSPLKPDLINNKEDEEDGFKTVQTSLTETETPQPEKKKRGRKKKDDKETADKEDIKPMKQLTDVFSALKKDKPFSDMSDEDKLRFCLNECFYPWKQKDFDKGDLTRDICLKPQFTEKLQWINNEYEGNAEIANGVAIKEWAEILSKYLIGPSDKDREVIIKILSEKQ